MIRKTCFAFLLLAMASSATAQSAFDDLASELVATLTNPAMEKVISAASTPPSPTYSPNPYGPVSPSAYAPPPVAPSPAPYSPSPYGPVSPSAYSPSPSPYSPSPYSPSPYSPSPYSPSPYSPSVSPAAYIDTIPAEYRAPYMGRRLFAAHA